jgi:hypothetical protein
VTLKINDLLTPAQIEDIAETTFKTAAGEHQWTTEWAEEKEYWVKSITEDLNELLPLVLSAISDRMNTEQGTDVLGRIMYGEAWNENSFRATRTDKVRGILKTIRGAK